MAKDEKQSAGKVLAVIHKGRYRIVGTSVLCCDVLEQRTVLRGYSALPDDSTYSILSGIIGV